MDEQEITHVVEALLLTSDVPLSIEKMQSAFPDWHRPNREQLHRALDNLKHAYQNRAIEIKALASGYTIQTKASYSRYISALLAEKPTKYSSALLEVLAIIAYKQPVTRADIEEVRGVAVSSSLIKTLLERQWVHSVGQREVPGKPVIYGTTKQFLDYFNLSSLQDLPPIGTNTP